VTARTVLVVGAGPAGAAAALAARARGAAVVLAERAFAGGNAVAHSLLPSKVHLAATADLAAYARWGLGSPPEGAPWAVGAHLRWRREAARTAYEEDLDGAGVDRVSGAVTFEGPGRARIEGPTGGRDLAFDAVVIATGSVQAFPPGTTPDGRVVRIARDLASLDTVPATAAVLGAGPTGVEIATVLAGYGTRVTLVGRAPGLLPGEDPVLADALARTLAGRGVELVLAAGVTACAADGDGVRVDLADGRSLRFETAFVATGRRGATQGLAVDRLGLAPDGTGYLPVDGCARTAAPGVFAAGDVTGEPLVANKAAAQGAVAGARAASGEGEADAEGKDLPTLDPAGVPTAVFSQPEYARVGIAPGSAAAAGLSVWAGDDLASLRRHVLGRETSSDAVRVAVGPAGEVRGAAILGDGAAERIALAAAAIAWHVPAAALANLLPVVPSAGETWTRLRP